MPPGGSDGSLTSRAPGPEVEPEPQRFGTEKIGHRRYAPMPDADGEEQLQPPRHDDVVRFGGQVQPPLG